MKSLIAITLLLISTVSYGDTVVHKEKSLYQNIVVTEKAGKRCLVFFRKAPTKKPNLHRY
jgi:hypothetical protein